MMATGLNKLENLGYVRFINKNELEIDLILSPVWQRELEVKITFLEAL